MVGFQAITVQNASAVPTFNGGWTQPLNSMPSPSAGFMANNCGYSGYGSYISGKYHIANDYGVGAGTAVYSIGSGTVVAVQTGWPGSAVFVRYTAADGTQFLAVYGHINNYVGVGSTVGAGQQVGTIYDQGGNDHLHFGVRASTAPASSNNGSMPCSSWPDANGYVDPLPYLGVHPANGSQLAQSTQPAAVSWGAGRIDVFVQGQDSKLWQARYDSSISGSGWSWFQPNNQTIFSSPAVSTWGTGTLDVFTRGYAGDLLIRQYDSSGWQTVETLGGTIQDAPAAVSWASGHTDVFVRGGDGKLYKRSYDSSTSSSWLPWTGALFSDVLGSSPAVASWGPNRLDVFARSTGGALLHAWYDSAGWHGFESLGGQIKGAPAAVSWGNGRIDVFVQGTDNKLWQAFYSTTTNSWTWATPGNQTIYSAPTVSSWGANRLDVFYKGASGNLVHQWYNNGWWPAESLGGLIN